MRLDPELTRKILDLATDQAGPGVAGTPGLTEKAFQAEVLGLATRFGWATYHTHDSRKSQTGFPDLTLIRGPVLIAAELKIPPRRPTASQSTWLELFAGVKVVRSELWIPNDWRSIVEVLQGRQP